MPYCTRDELERRYGLEEIVALTDRSGTGVEDTDVVDACLADADAEIDGYLAGRYAVPVVNPPAMLVRLAAIIARYRLYADQATAQVRLHYEDARRTLEAIAAGRVSLGADAAVVAAPSDGDVEFTSTPPLIFSREARQ